MGFFYLIIIMALVNIFIKNTTNAYGYTTKQSSDNSTYAFFYIDS